MSGKSAFTLASFVLNPYDDFIAKKASGIDIDLQIHLWSMEMSAEILVTKAVARKIFKDYKILTDINYILSRGKNRCNQEIYDLVLKTRNYFEELESVVTIYTSSNPTGIHRTLKHAALSCGKEDTKPVEINEYDALGNVHKKTVQQFVKYTPNHPNRYIIGVQDHVALQKQESGAPKVKDLIDRLVNYVIDDKLRYNITDVFCQQINRGSESVDRQRTNSIDIQLSDLRDSSDTAHGADFVLGLANPFQYEISPYRDYDIKKLQDRFRSIKIIKARDGISSVTLGMAFLGEVGLFRELPKGKDMSEDEYKHIMKIKKYQ